MTARIFSEGWFWPKLEAALLRVTKLFEYESALAAGFPISAHYSYGDVRATKTGAPHHSPPLSGEGVNPADCAA